MYNDPNQPQQPPSPYGQQQAPYGIPPVPTYAAQPPPKRRRTWLWIILGVIGALLVVCVGGSFIVFNVIMHNPATDVVNQYYTAVKSQDYTTAFGSLDSNMKFTAQGTNQQVTQDLFTQAGQALDTQKGKVSSYTISSTSLNTNNGVNTASFIVSVTRNGTPYDVHLELQQEGSTWKIVSFDNL